jgi:hypothetical protein
MINKRIVDPQKDKPFLCAHAQENQPFIYYGATRENSVIVEERPDGSAYLVIPLDPHGYFVRYKRIPTVQKGTSERRLLK